MDPLDAGAFDRAFRRVAGAFRLKLKEGELTQLSQTYFRVLAAYPLADVVAAGTRVLGTATRFPKVAEWLAALPAPPAPPPTDRRQLTVAECEARADADHQAYAAPPCACPCCEAAGASDRELRYVPDDDAPPAFNAWKGVVELTGHWAHGEELARWYAAQAAFYARGRAGRWRVPAGLPREPGEEG